MLVFIIALFFGVGQVLLTEKLICAFNKGESKKILLLFGAKVMVYAVGIGILILKFIWNLGLAFCGFVVGVPLAAIGIFVYKTIYKK